MLVPKLVWIYSKLFLLYLFIGSQILLLLTLVIGTQNRTSKYTEENCARKLKFIEKRKINRYIFITTK